MEENLQETSNITNEKSADTKSDAPPEDEVKVSKNMSDRNQVIKEENNIKGANLFDPNNLGVLNDVSISLTIEIGRAQIKIRDLLNLTKGSIIELNKLAGDPVDIYANGKLISTGNIITANGKYCVRITSMPERSHLGVESDGK